MIRDTLALLLILSAIALLAILLSRGDDPALVVANSAGAWSFNAASANEWRPAWRLYTTCPVNRRNVPILPERRT